jgi:putative ABC transport system ATP-binding protein
MAAGTPLILVDEVTKVYRSGSVEFPALRGVTLQVEAGSFLAVMGPSGSGKSTLMNILGFLDRPTTGRYVLEGVEVSGMSRGDLAAARNQRVGFVFQSFNLVARTTSFENVEMPLLYAEHTLSSGERRERVLAALDRVGMADKAWKLPSQLSGGEQQRVAIARSLINHPALLLADEPTGALDSQTSFTIMELFTELNDEGNTIVLVTHEPDIAQFARRRIVLRDGRIVRDEAIPRRAGAGTPPILPNSGATTS